MTAGPCRSQRTQLYLLLALLAGSVAIACQSAAEPTQTAQPTIAPAPVATATPTPVPGPTQTAIPDIGLIDTRDPAAVEALRTEELNAAGHYDEVRVADDGTRHLIPLQAIEWGGVARDGIPALDAPSYVGPERWSEMVYDPDGLVIGVEVDGKYRAYPLQILIWHEIVNETFNGKHLLVTY